MLQVGHAPARNDRVGAFARRPHDLMFAEPVEIVIVRRVRRAIETVIEDVHGERFAAPLVEHMRDPAAGGSTLAYAEQLELFGRR